MIIEIQETSSPWQFVNLADYHPPTTSVKVASGNWFASLRRRLRRDRTESEAGHPINDLQALSDSQRERLAPAPDWRDAVASLDVALEGLWTGQRTHRGSVFLIGPPHSGCAEILKLWAEQRQWRLLDPPSPQQILAPDPAWLGSLIMEHRPWVFPHLERTYLRHAGGLRVLRQFLNEVSSGRLGSGIIGCDSWAWAFVRRIGAPVVRSATLTLQAFDEKALTLYFQKLADASSGQPLLFRQADSGHYILPLPAGTVGESRGQSDFLHHLAAYSRGILGIAWVVWRASLRTRSDDEKLARITAEAPGELPCLTQNTVWIAPWDPLQQPALPPGAGRKQAFVLHSLLLHDGLSADLLGQLLPLSANQVLETLYLLQDAMLVEQDGAGGIWRVAPMGYPTVRKFLHDEGFFVDDS